MVRGDLDWIVMRALEKKRSWRYDTASSIVVDIESYLGHLPLPSRGRSFKYWVKKFLRRNRRLCWLVSFCVVAALAASIVARHSAEKSARIQADAVYDRLMDTRIEKLPAVIEQLKPYRRYVEDRLRRDVASSSSSATRARLVLLGDAGVDPASVGPWLLGAPADEIKVVLGMFEGHSTDALEAMAWEALEDGEADVGRRIRAAVVLASCDPENERWDRLADQVASWVMTSGPVEAPRWASLLHRIGLEEPVITQFAATDGYPLFTMAAILLQMGGWGEGALKPEIAKAKLRSRTGSSREAAARVVARLCILGLLAGQPAHAWEHLRHDPYPEWRTQLIHSFARHDVDEKVLADRLVSATDSGVLCGILVALGDYSESQIPDQRRLELKPILESLYESNADPGVRSSAEWLLREWELDEDLRELDSDLRSGAPKDGRKWYLTKRGEFTMSILPSPMRFQMGSPRYETGNWAAGVIGGEKQHLEEIDRTVAVATKEVTVEQFMEFAREAVIARQRKPHALAGEEWDGLMKKLRPTKESAMCLVTLKEAMAFCRWLSEREGIGEDQQCYVYDPEGVPFDEATLVAKEGYLNKTGYRLPTEAEWEYACRGGTESARYYGSSSELLPKYAWFRGWTDNYSRQPGLLRPNAYGLFDSLGNGAEWCQEPYQKDYKSDPNGKRIVVDEVTKKPPAESSWHVFRGGSFLHRPENVRAAWRNATTHPNLPFTSFRVARTIKASNPR